MALILKQSTAVDVLIGPFVDVTDGATAEEAETPVVLVSKNGQALVAKNDATTPVHDDAGYYNCELDATDTATVGTLILIVEKSATALPVRHEFQVVETAIYDALFADAATGALPVSSGGIASTAFAAGAINAAAIATDAIDADAIAAGAIDSGAFAAGAITAAAIATDAIDADALSADALAEINAQVVDVLNVDTFAEPTGVPPATASLTQKIGTIYMMMRNKVTVTATKKTFFGDDDVAEFEKDLSDDATTYTETEINVI